MNSGSRIVFSVPKPPSLQQTSKYPDATLAWIKARMCELLSAIAVRADGDLIIDHGAYSVMYTCVHDYCSVSHGVYSEKLYRTLEEFLQLHCRDIRREILKAAFDASDQDISILRTYIKEWRQYFALAKINAHLFAFLERH